MELKHSALFKKIEKSFLILENSLNFKTAVFYCFFVFSSVLSLIFGIVSLK